MYKRLSFSEYAETLWNAELLYAYLKASVGAVHKRDREERSVDCQCPGGGGGQCVYVYDKPSTT